MRHIAVISILFLATHILGCGGVGFENSDGDAVSKISASETAAPGDPDGDSADRPNDESSQTNPPPQVSGDSHTADEFMAASTACELLSQTPAQGGNRTDQHHHGDRDELVLADANNAVVNGDVAVLAINGANHVVTNGRIGEACIVATKISGLNGSSADSAKTVLIGEQGRDLSEIGAIDGNANTQLLIQDFHVITYNGNAKLLILDNTHIENLNGRIEELHLLNGSTLGTTNGSIGQIHIQ